MVRFIFNDRIERHVQSLRHKEKIVLLRGHSKVQVKIARLLEHVEHGVDLSDDTMLFCFEIVRGWMLVGANMSQLAKQRRVIERWTKMQLTDFSHLSKQYVPIVELLEDNTIRQELKPYKGGRRPYSFWSDATDAKCEYMVIGNNFVKETELTCKLMSRLLKIVLTDAHHTGLRAASLWQQSSTSRPRSVWHRRGIRSR